MKFVYILQSLKNSDRHYTGITDNLELRLAQHNQGNIKPTKAFAPWKIETYIAFGDHQKAINFEKYLKSGSGRAFAKKRL